jgi:hypothetical protein
MFEVPTSGGFGGLLESVKLSAVVLGSGEP